MNKYVFWSLAALLQAGAPTLRAQDFKTKFSARQNRKVVLDMQGCDVTVEGYDGNELLIQGKGNYEVPSAKADGLRTIYNLAQDNTRLGLAVSNEVNNTLRIVQVSRQKGAYTVKVPRQTAVICNQVSWMVPSHVLVRDVAGRIEVSLKSGDLKLLNVSGPVVAHSIGGAIVVKFDKSTSGPNAISTVSGNVDITLPASTEANFLMRTVSGEIYTDFDLSFGQERAGDLQHIGGATVDARVNGGGASFVLRSVSGNIFVRKASRQGQ